MLVRGHLRVWHSTKIDSSIVDDDHYDQISFFPDDTKDDYTGRSGVIDFDGGVFRDPWQSRPSKDFAA